MFQNMVTPVNGGGNKQGYILAGLGFYPYNSRCVFKSGYFYVKDGICYIDAVFTASTSISADLSVFSSAPTPSSTQGTSWSTCGDVKVKYNSSSPIVEGFHSASAISSGQDFTFKGQYYTDASDSPFYLN